MEEIIVSTRKVYSGRIVKLDVHEVVLNDGQHTKREQIRHPGAAAIVAIDEQQNVLLVRQYRLPAGRVMIELPAGTMYEDEPPFDCALREMQEETGYKPDVLEPLGGYYTAPGYTTEFIHLFLGTKLRPSTLAGDQDEYIELLRMPFAEALDKAERGEFQDGKTIIGLSRAARKLAL
ncbi:MAG: NUDIX hydrolase [Armatimonadetes bacterium]|nr:NUDIX hydrolase [Anaerolineae bacterium]